MADRKISTPSSSTGIVRFYDVQSSTIQLDPRVVVGVVVAFLIVIVALRML